MVKKRVAIVPSIFYGLLVLVLDFTAIRGAVIIEHVDKTTTPNNAPRPEHTTFKRNVCPRIN